MASIDGPRISQSRISNNQCTGDLLWVYEGLTEYLGKVLHDTQRPSGHRIIFRESGGRSLPLRWTTNTAANGRPLVDTATAVAVYLFFAAGVDELPARVDYYFEGLLLLDGGGT